MATGLTGPLRSPVTVLLPTHDHAESVGLAARSVLEQTMGDLTLVVIGDGVGDDTRDVVSGLAAQDERVLFVDRPKAPRHGEVLRHEVLSHVESPVIAYHGDDDLLLPQHLARMLETLGDRDFAHPLPVVVGAGSALDFLPTDLSRPECVAWHLPPGRRNAVSLTGVVHTLAAYRRLPHGWRAAPVDEWTDHHMWKQFFGVPGFRGVTGTSATTIKLPATARAGGAADEMGAEIAAWWQRMHEPGFEDWWAAEVRAALARAAVDATLRLAAREDDLAALAVAHDEAVAQHDRALSAHDEACAGRDQALLARDQAVAARDQALAQRDRAKARRGRAVRQRDRARRRREQAVRQRDRALRQRDGAVAERDAAVAERDEVMGSTVGRLFRRLRGIVGKD